VTGLNMMPQSSKLGAVEKERRRKQIKIKTKMVMPTTTRELLHQSTRKKWMKCMSLSVFFGGVGQVQWLDIFIACEKAGCITCCRRREKFH
jgi:hypothetical protein